MNEKLKALIRQFLILIGENPDREGLAETPCRVVKALGELLGGYGYDPQAVLSKNFTETNGYDQMIAATNISFVSFCEHHLLPFYGRIDFAYIPNKRVIGLSKIPRVIKALAAKLQIQERMTQEIAGAFQEALSPQGLGVRVTAKHLCVGARGIKEPELVMTTQALTGCFYQPAVREEFMGLCLK